ncbi:hypothetical protein BS47DRAFT_1312769 [Hydnum rufescens UP504]|uniref:SH3 domain-containing protein n=1 Tax=Hydnum rufescens UP504 TaxID=1448309 RepID=A0A9P6BAI1_9AGAM|nr:hypothetical protein BS47DRAFT_1312769 [Hydnum rufescens UP504]
MTVLASYILRFAILVFVINVVVASVPKVDFRRMGKVALTGSFAGLDVFNNSTLVFDPSTSALVSRAANGTLIILGSTNVGGSITAACMLNNNLYVAGNFSSLSGVPFPNVASYNTTSGKFVALGSGLDATVDALYCDVVTGNVWVGGTFHAPVGADASLYGGSVAIFDTNASRWSPAAFVGLSGFSPSVRSIVPSSSGSSLYFGGSFVTTYGSSTRAGNSTNNPNVPYSSGASPFSSSLVPLPLTTVDINANPSSSLSGFNNITNVLCPAGSDGPGNSWFSTAGTPTLITVRTNKYATARGVRLGNTFLQGRGTKTFNVISIPDNNILTLTYIDPSTKATLTCSNSCPLLSDPSVPYQDFTFDASTTLTGVQITLLSWSGPGSGLHLLQVLSDGAFASSIPSNNGISCYSPSGSSVKSTGQWSVVTASTSIAATTQTVLMATVNVGTAAGDAPTLTWYPYVSASGTYDVYLYIPGCNDLQDCARRTSVKVAVYPGGGAQPRVTTVSQRVTTDTRTLVYSGYVIPSSPAFTSTVSLGLADAPEGTGLNGQYDIIADRVQFTLTSLNTTSGNSTTVGSLLPDTNGFGFFEWPLQNSPSLNATGVISNISETAFETASAAFAAALGSSLSSAVVKTIIATSDSVVFLGGSFSVTNIFSNLVAFRDGAVAPVSGNGLNGVVNSMAFANGTLFVGGAFSDTVSGGSSGLHNIAKYSVGSGTWTSLGGGVNGDVSSLSISKGRLSIVGNFTETFVNGFGSPVGGVAVWDIDIGKWITSGGLYVGSATLALPGSGGLEYIAGNLAAASGFGATGWAILQADKNGQPLLTPPSTSLDDSTPVTGVSTNSTAVRRRGERRPRHTDSVVAWLVPRIRAAVFPRQSSPTPAALPLPTSTPAPAVFAGAFWKDASNSHELFVLGGNFSFFANDSSSRSDAVALYDPTSFALSGLQGDQINGVVLSLLVSNNHLFVGGNFTLRNESGFVIYDLVGQNWQTIPQTLNGSNGVIVRSVSSPPSDANSIIVAGTFTTAGSVSCVAICSWDRIKQTWAALGNGIKGEVTSVDYAKDPADTLVVAGSLVLSDGTPANVAKYHFVNSTWSPIGSGLPGPVSAIRINDQNLRSIFVAGRSADGTTPFMLHWDGSSWNSLGDEFQGSTAVSQLAMVPLQDTHSANGVLQQDRMLLISGSLTSHSYGNISSALYDGNTFYPYLSSTSLSGGFGVISGLFNSIQTFSFIQPNFLAAGVIILISIAISAGIVFFLLLIGVLWTLLSREPSLSIDPKEEQDDDSSLHHRPSSLLEHINAATRTTIVGTGALATATGRETQSGSRGSEEFGGLPADVDHDGSGWRRSETPAVGPGGVTGAYEQEEEGRPAHARYSFDGEGEGELPLQTGAELAVLDDRDAAWWYVRDQRTGREGIVPAAYLY